MLSEVMVFVKAVLQVYFVAMGVVFIMTFFMNEEL